VPNVNTCFTWYMCKKRFLAKMEQLLRGASRSPTAAAKDKRDHGLSKAARRKVRQAVALAIEMELPSIALCGVVWHINTGRQHKPPGNAGKEQQGGTATKTRSPSGRKRDAERRARHAEQMEHIRIFRVRRAFSGWRDGLARSRGSLRALEQPPPGGQLLMEVDEGKKKGARALPSPAPAASPREPNPKRAVRCLYPPDPTQPPPSLPPSPPQTPERDGGDARAGAGRGSPRSASDRAERCEGVEVRAPFFPWTYWTSAVKIQSAYRRIAARDCVSTLRVLRLEDAITWSDSSDEEEEW
jgi:hypothetical protein